VAFSPELEIWVGCGEGTNTLAWSHDGISWFAATSGGSILSACYCVAWSSTDATFVAGGAAGTGRIAYSTDGMTWTVNTQSVISTAVNDIAYGRTSDIWVAVGSGTNDIATASTASGTWTGRGTFFTGGGLGACFSVPLGKFLAVGQYTPNVVASAGTTGTPFSGLGNVAFTGGYSYNCDFGNGKYILAGSNFGSQSLATSTDGVSFSPHSFTGFSSYASDVNYAIDYDIWVATGAGGSTMAYSLDNGVTFFGLGASIFTSNGNAVMSRNSVASTPTKKRALLIQQLRDKQISYLNQTSSAKG
jgi:hypothetical protein